MTRLSVIAAVSLGLATAGAWAASSYADPIPRGQAATVYVTQTETVRVNQRIEKLDVRAWHKRAVANRRTINATNLRLTRANARIRRQALDSRRRWAPTVSLAIGYAISAYGVDLSARVRCESHGDPYARNASGATGLLQFLPSTWRTTPFAGFSIYDPVAQALAGGWMVRVGLIRGVDLSVVAALFVGPAGSYSGLPDVDLWDEARDARLYAGPWPVVAHPPCNRWCMLASVNEARWGATIGDDGGCFAAALASVRKHGGVLEHPAYSLAWSRFGLPHPSRHGWASRFDCPGFAAEVSQSAYGHPARKRTWLYAVGVELPELRWGDPNGERVVGAGVNSGQSSGRGRLTAREAIHTPPEFRDVLLAMARSASRQASAA